MRTFLLGVLAVLPAQVSARDYCDLDPADKTWCVVSEFADPQSVKVAMRYICKGKGIDCKQCPKEKLNDWAFNEYFKKNYVALGSEACNFKGAGKLRWSDTSPCRPSPNAEINGDFEWCLPQAGTPQDDMQKQFDYACGTVDCSHLAKAKGCVFPKGLEIQYNAEWAYNAFYKQDPEKECDFEGTGELMNVDCSPSSEQGTVCGIDKGVSEIEVFHVIDYIRLNAKEVNDISDRCPWRNHNKDAWLYNQMFRLHYKEAGNHACQFSGTGKLSWPRTSSCRPNYVTSVNKQWCLPKPSATAKQLGDAIGFICGHGIDCSMINPGGDCVFPEASDIEYKAQWAFNRYYYVNRKRSCNYNGAGELVDIKKGLPTPKPPAPAPSPCTLDPKQGTWCVVSPWADGGNLAKNLKMICDSGVDCSKCPESADWKYNEYFQKNRGKGCNFDGTGKLLWSPSSPCRPSRDDKQWCVPLPDAKVDELKKDVAEICDSNMVDCKTIKDAATCVYPAGKEILYQAEYAYNAYYQAKGKCPGSPPKGEYMTPDCKASDDQASQCEVSADAEAFTVYKSVVSLCSTNKVLCDRCPVESHVKNSWIYNEYFKANVAAKGSEACSFDGSGMITWPSSGSPCRAKYTDAERNWCVPTQGKKEEEYEDAIAYICGTGEVDCSVISDGSDCIFPYYRTGFYKGAWAFDAYFRATGGKTNDACDFQGAATITWPEESPCRLDPTDQRWCVSKPGIDPAKLADDIGYVCSMIDCKMIGDGECLFPKGTELVDKANWVFNQYYQQHKSQGNSACDWEGHAKLIDAYGLSVMEQQTNAEILV